MEDWKNVETYKDEAWDKVARANDLGCKVCGSPNPDRGEREMTIFARSIIQITTKTDPSLAPLLRA